MLVYEIDYTTQFGDLLYLFSLGHRLGAISLPYGFLHFYDNCFEGFLLIRFSQLSQNFSDGSSNLLA